MEKAERQNPNAPTRPGREFQKLADVVRAAHRSRPYQIEVISGHDDQSATAVVGGGKKDTDPLFYVTVDLRDFKPSISLGKMGMDEYLTGPQVDALYKEVMAEETTALVLPERPKKNDRRK